MANTTNKPKQGANENNSPLDTDLPIVASESHPSSEEGNDGARSPADDNSPIDGAKLLDELVTTLRKHLSLPDGAAEAIALWVMFAHGFDAADVSPRLALTSPVPGCGKSTVLSLLALLVPNPLPASNWSAASIFRSIEKNRPTLLIDEADTFLNGEEGLRGILNSGHTPAMAYVMRSAGENHEPTSFSTWSPIVMAKIGPYPETLEQRSIVIQMQKRRQDEDIERLRPCHHGGLGEFRLRMEKWAKENLDNLSQADPKIPSSLVNRSADNWRPLFAIADLVGGHWPETVRAAAQSFQTEAEPTRPEQIIAAINVVLKSRDENRISSKELCGALEVAGINIQPTRLASVLKTFGIKPKGIRIGDKTPKGYTDDQFEDAFARYLPREQHLVTPD